MQSQEELFREVLLDVAGSALRKAHPEYVATFEKALNESGRDVDHAHRAVASIPTDKFAKWRKLLLSLYDVEFQVTEVRSALKLHGTRIDHPELLRSWSMTQTSWDEYHYRMWLYLMDGLLERVRKLVSQTSRELIRPFQQDWEDVERRLCGITDDLLERVGKLRDPVAHGGGAIRALAEERHLDELAVLQIWVEPLDLLKQRHEQFYRRAQRRLTRTTLLGFAVVEATFEALNKAVPWEKVREKWC